MYEQQNKQNTFFQPCFEQLLFSKSMSECSLFGNCQMDLNLEIYDVVDLNHEDLENYQLALNESYGSMVIEDVQEKLSSKDLSGSVEIEEKEIGGLKMEESIQLKQDRSNDKQLKKNNTLTKNVKKQKSPKTFYQKNICRNIIRKVIRVIQSGVYKPQLLQFCSNNDQSYSEFCRTMSSNLQMITGPSALKEFLQFQDNISSVFKRFSHWYLLTRYIRDAMNGGHMTNIDKYISYKNTILLPMLDKL